MFSSLKKEWTEHPPAVDLSSHFYFQTAFNLPPEKKAGVPQVMLHTWKSEKDELPLIMCK